MENIGPGELIAKLGCALFTRRMRQFEFKLDPAPRPPLAGEFLAVNGRQVPLALIRNARARRYVLRLRPDGSARVTVPRSGSLAEARRFARRHQKWLEKQLLRLAAQPVRPTEWRLGTEILFRGELVKLEADANGERDFIRLGGEVFSVANADGDLRPAMERHFWQLAAQELPPIVFEFAARHQLVVRRVTVRDQRSRWGSCSRRGTISLNWRLIQAPRHVLDYIILHELAHLREMNHSARFWREVERLCPEYPAAEQWLKRHASLLKK